MHAAGRKFRNESPLAVPAVRIGGDGDEKARRHVLDAAGELRAFERPLRAAHAERAGGERGERPQHARRGLPPAAVAGNERRNGLIGLAVPDPDVRRRGVDGLRGCGALAERMAPLAGRGVEGESPAAAALRAQEIARRHVAPVHFEKHAQEVRRQGDPRKVARPRLHRHAAGPVVEARAVQIEREHPPVRRKLHVLVPEVAVVKAGVVPRAAGGGDAHEEGDQVLAGTVGSVERGERLGHRHEPRLEPRGEPAAAVRAAAGGERLRGGAGDAARKFARGFERARPRARLAGGGVEEAAETRRRGEALHNGVDAALPRPEPRADRDVAALLQDHGARSAGIERFERLPRVGPGGAVLGFQANASHAGHVNRLSCRG